MITFKSFKNNPDIVKVYYKTIYMGRIIKNEDGLYEYQEKGHHRYQYLIDLETFQTLQEAEIEARDTINRRIADRLELSILGLTELGREFLSKFYDGPQLRKSLSSHDITIANFMVEKGLLEKGRSDDKQASVIYYMDETIKEKVMSAVLESDDM